MLRNYLKSDFYRALTSWKWWFSIAGIALFFLYSTNGGYGDVCGKYYLTFWMSTGIIIYLFGTFLVSTWYIEDSQNKYWYHAVMRGSLGVYTLSKVLTCIAMSIFSMICGVFLFVAISSFSLPLIGNNGALLLSGSACSVLLNSKWVLLFFVYAAIEQGLLSSLLALISMYFSLYVKDRLFVISAPVILYYFLGNIVTDSFEKYDAYINIRNIYDAGCSIGSNPILHCLYVFAFTFILEGAIAFASYRKIKKEIRSEGHEKIWN